MEKTFKDLALDALEKADRAQSMLAQNAYLELAFFYRRQMRR